MKRKQAEKRFKIPCLFARLTEEGSQAERSRRCLQSRKAVLVLAARSCTISGVTGSLKVAGRLSCIFGCNHGSFSKPSSQCAGRGFFVFSVLPDRLFNRQKKRRTMTDEMDRTQRAARSHPSLQSKGHTRLPSASGATRAFCSLTPAWRR